MDHLLMLNGLPHLALKKEENMGAQFPSNKDRLLLNCGFQGVYNRLYSDKRLKESPLYSDNDDGTSTTLKNPSLWLPWVYKDRLKELMPQEVLLK